MSHGFNHHQKGNMKRLRTKTLLVTAVTAALLVAIPASASASEWLKNGSTLTENATVKFSGAIERHLYVNKSTPFYGCEFEAEALLKPGSTGELKSFSIKPQHCGGVGPGAENCSLSEVKISPETVTSAIHIGGEPSKPTIIINKVIFGWFFNSSNPSCWFFQFEKPAYYWYSNSEFVLQPDNAASISKVTLSGADPTGSGRDYYGDASLSPAGVFGVK
jgi:hypothetical protein